MFPGKEDLFLRKWEGQIVPQLLKVAAIETPGLLPDGEESDGKLPTLRRLTSIPFLLW